MINCDKRQREVKRNREGIETEEFRCVEKKALDTYLQIVDVPTCQVCPILALKPKSCSEPAWMSELISVTEVSRDAPLAEYGYEQSCQYRWDSKCKITGRAINPEICKACDQETADHMATLPEMVAGFAIEVKRWIREGRPVRTDEEVSHILNTYCKPCKLYDAKKQACTKCGCSMNNSSWPLLNGIKMATKICPAGLWR